MVPSPPPAFVRLVTLPDQGAAEVVAALLRSAGIPTRLRGESLGPYRLTIGEMAQTEVLVPVAHFEDARAALEDSDLPEDATVAGDLAEPKPAVTGGRWWPLVALGLLAIFVGLLLARLL